MRKIFLLGTFLITCAAAAQEPLRLGSADRDLCKLEPTWYGEQIKAGGLAMKGTLRDLQLFGVSLTADVPDGTVYVVGVFDGQDHYLAGSVTMFLGAGQLKVLYQTDPQGGGPLPPVSTIRQVFISDLADTLLQGLFGPPDDPP